MPKRKDSKLVRLTKKELDKIRKARDTNFKKAVEKG